VVGLTGTYLALCTTLRLEGSCDEWVHGIEPVLQLFVFSLQQHASVLGADGEGVGSCSVLILKCSALYFGPSKVYDATLHRVFVIVINEDVGSLHDHIIPVPTGVLLSEKLKITFARYGVAGQ